MIDHTDCDHDLTRAARARCRRQRAGGTTRAPRQARGATPRTIDPDDTYGQTPRDRHLECDKCGVERITHVGTDPITGIKLFVGDKCLWYIKRADDLTPLD